MSRQASKQIQWLLSDRLPSTFLPSFQMIWSRGLRRRSLITNLKDMPVHHVPRVVSTLMRDRNANVTRNQTRKLIDRHGRILERVVTENPEGKLQTFHHDQPRASSRINDNQCLDRLQVRLLAGSTLPRQTMKNFLEGRVSLQKSQIKICERCFVCHSIVLCSTCNKCQKCCIKSPCRGQTSKLLANLAGPRSYTLPFRIRPKLMRSPTVISCYVNPHRNSYLLQALHQLIDKNAVELVQNQTSLGFFNRLFLVPKPNNKWRPILDLSTLIFFLKTEKFKMETPETIRSSLQQGEWVTSIDFKDAYFHIPIQEQSRKYLRFHVQGQTYQFKALPFDLSTAPLQFTVVAKEVKLMAIHKGIRIHQYLDDWLVRARSHHVGLQHTQDLVKISQELGYLVNLEKSELGPKQIFDFVGYQFDLRAGRVRPTLDRWQNLQDKIADILSLPACPVRQFMSLIGLLTATEKQVHLGRLHMNPYSGISKTIGEYQSH